MESNDLNGEKNYLVRVDTRMHERAAVDFMKLPRVVYRIIRDIT